MGDFARVGRGSEFSGNELGLWLGCAPYQGLWQSMFFTFWTPPHEGASSETLPMVGEWRGVFSAFEVFGDDAVCDILAKRHPSYADIYRRITIPACKSDVARLALLHEHGGMYVDAHCGIGSLAALSSCMELLTRHELIIFDRRDTAKSPGDTHLTNSILAGRRGSAVLDALIMKAFQNLLDQEAKENAGGGYVPYNIYVLTGPWHLSITLIDRSKPEHIMRPEFVGKVSKFDLSGQETFPARFYKYYGYRKPSTHWSERQAIEPLFLKREPCVDGSRDSMANLIPA